MSQTKQRGGSLTPPLFGMGHLRRAHGYSVEDVIEGLRALTGRTYQKGTISGVELGHRKPSDELVAALIEFYGLTDEPHVYARPRLVPSPPSTAVA